MRVSQGGHDVPVDKLNARFPRTMANLERAIREVGRIAAPDAWRGSFAVSPNGTAFLYAASLYSGQDLMLIENFR
jgi:hypothetical protein